MPRTLADDIESDVSRVFLDTRHFASSVTHYPAGVVASAATITAIFTEQEGTANSESEFRHGVLQLGSSVTLTLEDEFLINSEKWQVNRSKGWGALPGGMQQAHLSREIPNVRTKRRRM